ncbi:MAG: stage V sporulation protein S [Acidaminococcales bacterium]|jgi:stage V sporulation protein S|nr:stage V sporulation protein S [Acidaminococcales bacterium]
MTTFKVSAKTAPAKLAGAIAHELGTCDCVELQAIGAGAVNQAIKAIAIARGYLAPHGADISCQPAFVNLPLPENVERTAIRLLVRKSTA